MGNIISRIIKHFVFDPNGYNNSFTAEEYDEICKDFHYSSVHHKRLDIKTEYWVYDPEEYFFKRKAFVQNNKASSPHINVRHDEKNGIDILFMFHGNGETCLHSLTYLQPLIHDLYKEYLIVLVEYPYYGFNVTQDTKRPTEDETLEMSLTVYKDVMRRLSNNNIPFRSINILGRSLGTGVAVWMSKIIKHTNKVVLIHPFSSILDIPILGALGGFIGGMMYNKYNMFNSYENILETRANEFCIIHAKNDPLIPYTHSIRLYEQLIKIGKRSILYLVPDGGHKCSFVICPKVLNDLYDLGEISDEEQNVEYIGQIKEKAQRYDSNEKWVKYVGDPIKNGKVSISVYNDIKKFMLS